MVYRVYVEKKEALANEARALLEDLRAFLGIQSLTGLRLFNRYDLEGISRELFDYAVQTVLSEPQLDTVTSEVPQGDTVFAVEYLPGQYDQRADSAAQCIQILSQGERPTVRTARVYVLEGELTAEQVEAVKKYVINPVESREASLELPETLRMEYDIPTTVRTVEGFTSMDAAALDALRDELGHDKEVVFEAIEASLVSACKKNFGTSQNIKVVIDRESGNVACYAQKTVASPVEDPQLEISLEMARVLNPNYVVGDVVDLEVTPKDFGRISAQTAKQVVVQKFREAEREILFNQYITKEREVVTAIVQRKERRNVIVQMGKIDAILSANEQIPGEQYNFMDRIKVYVLEVKQTTKGPQIFVSRTHPELVKRLFEQEVPEVHDGTVEIKSIAREAGSRTKIAVYSKNENVDALGACVGQNGYRVNVIVSELGGEKIDVINWSEDPKEFIAAALSPSKVLEVALNEAEQSAKIVVPDHQLSLAIGKEGQNARLSAKLTGWRIDIKSETQARETNFLAEDPVTEEAAEETTAEETVDEAVEEAAEEDVTATEETAEGEAEA